MPDLTTEYYWQCETAECYSKEIKGSKGDTYTVTFGPTPTGKYQHDWSCTCKGFRFNHKCRHIEHVKAEHYCGWMQFTDGGEPATNTGEHYCPKCGALAQSRAWGV